MPGRARGALSVLCLAWLTATAAHADPTRFVPWTDGKTPALALNDVAGSPRTLADYRGKVVIVNFWATWCEPCLAEMPSMQKLQDRFTGRVAVVAVNYGESAAKVGPFLQRLGVSLTVLLDPNGETPRAWRVRLLPSSYVVAPDGQVRYRVLGEIDWNGDAAVKTTAELLGQSRP
jgi:thiol-disulfide isomerase/thioredoxin